MYMGVTDVFKYPCNSTQIGIMKLGQLCKKTKVIVSIDDIMKKCVLFENNNQNYAVILLHDS